MPQTAAPASALEMPVPFTAQVSQAFEAADWAFAGARAGRELHPYPARYVRELPEQALAVLEVDGPVIDPFCGSGTTLAVAQARGCEAVGVDLNPIACLISRVRTRPWAPADDEIARTYADALQAAALDGGEVPQDVPRLDHWFAPWAQHVLAGATTFLGGVDDPVWHDRLALSISATVVRLSRQESDTRYAAVDKAGSVEAGAAMLRASVLRIAAQLAELAVPGDAPHVEVACADARELPVGDDRFAAAVFSPPYPNAYEYWLYHKYRMYWLGYDPIAVREEELGARPHYCRPNGLTEDDFARQMKQVFAELGRVLLPDAPAVAIVGDSWIGGRQIDNGALLIEAALDNGFRLGAHARRPLNTRRSSFNRAHSRGRVEEHVLLLWTPS